MACFADVAEFIEIIDDPDHEVIEGKYKLSDAQARAILELRLQRLTGMERGKLVEETKELSEKINEYLSILQSSDKLIQVVKKELIEAKGTSLMIVVLFWKKMSLNMI